MQTLISILFLMGSAFAKNYTCNVVEGGNSSNTAGELKQIKLEATKNKDFAFRSFYRRDWAIERGASGLMRNCSKKAGETGVFLCYSWNGWGSDDYTVRAQIKFEGTDNPFASGAPNVFKATHHKVYELNGEIKLRKNSQRELVCK